MYVHVFPSVCMFQCMCMGFKSERTLPCSFSTWGLVSGPFLSFSYVCRVHTSPLPDCHTVFSLSNCIQCPLNLKQYLNSFLFRKL